MYRLESTHLMRWALFAVDPQDVCIGPYPDTMLALRVFASPAYSVIVHQFPQYHNCTIQSSLIPVLTRCGTYKGIRQNHPSDSRP